MRAVYEGKKSTGLENKVGEDGYLQAYILQIKANLMFLLICIFLFVCFGFCLFCFVAHCLSSVLLL